MQKLAVTLLAALCLVSSTWAYSAGAPESACDDMIPRHGVDAQPSKIPYKIALKKPEVAANQEIVLTISGPKPFKGFLVQVREGDKAVGAFQIADTDRYSKTLNCHGGTATAATHKNATDKNDFELTWKAPSKPGTYKIFATIAENGGVFWAHHELGSITVV